MKLFLGFSLRTVAKVINYFLIHKKKSVLSATYLKNVCYISETRKKRMDAGQMSPISGIVLIMKDTRAISVINMDYKGIGEDRNQSSMIND